MSDPIRLSLLNLSLFAPDGRCVNLRGNDLQADQVPIPLTSLLSEPIFFPDDFGGFPVPPVVHRDSAGNLWLDWTESTAMSSAEVVTCLTDRIFQICLEWSHEFPGSQVQILDGEAVHPDWVNHVVKRLGPVFPLKIGS
ncbi:MAG: hypothetical protein HUU10_05870 [Bacteroidetes bacterium]|nr:hypothetical protein [Bacteroidota bacterium]